jgi:hypothetical protein
MSVSPKSVRNGENWLDLRAEKIVSLNGEPFEQRRS